MKMIDLNGNDWLFKEYYGQDWEMRAAVQADTPDTRWWKRGTVPGSPQHDLWMLGEIPDPYVERNSLLIEWIPQRTWVYKKSFMVDASLRGKRLRLHLKGVDYESAIYLNGVLLGKHTGLYTPIIFDVSSQLHYGEENLLAVVIQPAPIEEPQIGRTSRVSSTKGRMSYWWDFCPRMVHLGIWDDVTLEASDALLITDVWAKPQLSDDFSQADVEVQVTLDGAYAAPVRLTTTIQHDGAVVSTQSTLLEKGISSSVLTQRHTIANPTLWHPNGNGEAALYEVNTTVLLEPAAGSPIVSDEHHTRIGIRKLEFVANDGASASALPYVLVANGQKTYLKGWNWVPMDVMYGVDRPHKLRRLLKLAKEANVNLLRVWGGGLIEKDAFYDLCDEYGILIWQEFIQSSSGLDNFPPTAPEYIAALVREAEQIIPRKRNHPALAVWCGGNELMGADSRPLNSGYPTLAALKAVVNRLDPGRMWLPTSSSGEEFSNSLETIARNPQGMHDVHGPWEYQGVKEQYELYNNGACLLHSEFGVEGITNAKTLNHVIAPEHQMPVNLDANPYWFHLAAWWVRRKVWDTIFGILPDVSQYLRATQFTQFEGLRYALEADRRRKYHNSGTLPWQFNEPFPMAACTSAVDYYGQPKPAYYAVQSAYEPLHISAIYASLTWQDEQTFSAEIWVNNSSLHPIEAVGVQARLLGADGSVFSQIHMDTTIPANAAVRIGEISAETHTLPVHFLLDLALVDGNQHSLAENRYLFTRESTLASLFTPAPADITIDKEIISDESWQLTLRNNGGQTAFYLWLEDARPLGAAGYAYFDANYFCLLPGENRAVTITWQDVPPSEQSLRLSGWNIETITL